MDGRFEYSPNKPKRSHSPVYDFETFPSAKRKRSNKHIYDPYYITYCETIRRRSHSPVEFPEISRKRGKYIEQTPSDAQSSIPYSDVEDEQFKFKLPFTAIIGGPQSSGKTTFLLKLIIFIKSMVTPEPAQIVYCYGEYNKSIPEFVKHGVIPHHGIPSESFLNQSKKPLLLILDDLMLEMDKRYLDHLFTVKSHHRNIGVIFVVQNLFEKNIKTARDNSQYLILMRSPSSARQIRDIGSSLFPTKTRKFMEIYDMATADLYGYLLIDTHASTHRDHMLRTDIFPGEFTKIFHIH